VTLVAVAIVGAGPYAAQGKGSGVVPLPESFCSPLMQGSTPAQVVIASDLPVRYFDHRATTLKLQAAIKYVLARRGYMAGKYSVGYQACDDSSPQQGEGALAKCAANARAYAGDADVVGLVGTWSSRCTAIELPILNRATGGPLGLISASNTNVGLTHAGAGTEPGEPGRYYPTGRRNFVRIISPDDAQGVADTLLVKRLGAKRVFVLDDHEEYGLNVGGAFKKAAAKIGLRIAGTASWSPDQTSFDTLVSRVVKAKPDAVFLAGFACSECGRLVEGLRGRLPAKTPIIGSDGFNDFEGLAKAAGAAAEGMYVSVPGLPPERLPAAGRRIGRLFGATHLGAGGPAYAAQAVDVLLDAIAASDGTRSSVTRHLLEARVRGGIIGSFSFDRNGDTTFNPTMIFRIRNGKGKLDRLIAPPPGLVS
jgi:branched-chain amino acid transport system substrate-binding protein